MRVNSEELIRMFVLQGTGKTFEESGFPNNAVYRAAWAGCIEEADDIERKGGIIDLPMDLPDLTQRVQYQSRQPK